MAPDVSELTSSSDLALGYAASRRRTVADVYSEAVFRYFLNIERRRAEHAGRSVVLVLVSLRNPPGSSQPLGHRAATSIFSALASSVREVDFVGWFRDGYVAAAALAQQGPPQPSIIGTRINDAMRRELGGEAATVRLRVVSLGAARR